MKIKNVFHFLLLKIDTLQNDVGVYACLKTNIFNPNCISKISISHNKGD